MNTLARRLTAEALGTALLLVVLIPVFGPISGAHFNPAVTLVNAWQGGLPWREVPGYARAQAQRS